jgi:hypothetical protein
MNEIEPICCEPGCGAAADFEIQEDRTDIHPCDCYTHACTRHVGDLLGSVVPEHPVFHWHVSALKVVK